MIFSEKQHRQINYYLLVLFCFCLPLIPRISVLALVLFILNTAASGMLWRNRKKAFGKWPLLFSSFYLLHLIGMIYTENNAEGLLDLETKLSFLLLPPVLFATPPEKTKERSHILLAFVAGCTIGTLYAYFQASLLYIQTGLNAFFYEYLAGYLNFHPSYLAIYLIFAIFLLLEEFVRKKNQLSFSGKALRGLLVIHFLVFIFLLTARMQLLISVFLFSVAIIWYLASQNKLLKGIPVMLLFILLTGGFMWSVPTTRVRILNAYEQWSNPEVAPNVRWPIWKVSKELIEDSPLIGHGTGDVQDNLMRLYERNQITRALESRYNCHNQYLQSGIALGLSGMLLLFGCLFLPLAAAIRQRNYIYFFFLGLLILSMVTECVLEIQQGILFYAFFNSFFALGFVKGKT